MQVVSHSSIMLSAQFPYNHCSVHEPAHTLAMIKNSFGVIKSVVEHLNSRQTPVITFDQPLYALARQLQVQWNKYVVICGGLYIETATLKTLGDWLSE